MPFYFGRDVFLLTPRVLCSRSNCFFLDRIISEVLMSVAGSNCNGSHSGGRKRKLNSTSGNGKKQTKLTYPSSNNQAQALDCITKSPMAESTDGESSELQSGSITPRASLNNHVKKPGTGKKLVIKNMKGKDRLYGLGRVNCLCGERLQNAL